MIQTHKQELVAHIYIRGLVVQEEDFHPALYPLLYEMKSNFARKYYSQPILLRHGLGGNRIGCEGRPTKTDYCPSLS